MAALDDLLEPVRGSFSEYPTCHLDRATFATGATEDGLEFGAIKAFGQDGHIDQHRCFARDKFIQLAVSISRRGNDIACHSCLKQEQLEQVALLAAMKEDE